LKKKKREIKKEGKYEVEEMSVIKDLSYPHIPVKKKRIKDFFMINCFQNIILQDGWRKKSLFEGIKRKMCCFEEREIESEAGSSTLKQKDLLKKFKDPVSFNISVSIDDLFIGNALLDLRSSINLMPLTILRQIGELEVKPTKMQTTS